ERNFGEAAVQHGFKRARWRNFGGKAFRITSSPLFKTSGSSPEGRKISSLFSAASSSAALNRIIELPPMFRPAIESIDPFTT
ncbi:MAG TPA: hypothetical protein VIU12_23580, partial [Chryseolinea sp.]